ncbi:MAG: hypothetical protein V1891_04345 [bacterium]
MLNEKLNKNKDSIKNFNEMRKVVLDFLGEKDDVRNNDFKKANIISIFKKQSVVNNENLEKKKIKQKMISKKDIKKVKEAIFENSDLNLKIKPVEEIEEEQVLKKFSLRIANNFNEDIIKKKSKNLIDLPKNNVAKLLTSPIIKKTNKTRKLRVLGRKRAKKHRVNYNFFILNSVLVMLFALVILIVVFLACIIIFY